MALSPGRLRQIALPSGNLARTVQFYRDILGLEFIAQYDPPGLVFFRLGATRLLLESSSGAPPSKAVLYFEVPDIAAACSALKEKGVAFDSEPRMIYRDDAGTFGPAGEEEWMAFFKDPDGNVLALASRRQAGV
jgi:methylmalonyl-CoA/ethylmalonyl-CoA epimerase